MVFDDEVVWCVVQEGFDGCGCLNDWQVEKVW